MAVVSRLSDHFNQLEHTLLCSLQVRMTLYEKGYTHDTMIKTIKQKINLS
jgi:hypothetical protein